MKTCSLCKVDQPLTWFNRDHSRRDGRQRYCKPCRFREGIRRNYGLSHEAYDAMLIAQSGRCDSCRTELRPRGNFVCVDHCHATGRVRGLLCVDCNGALGLLHDDPVRIQALLDYLTA